MEALLKAMDSAGWYEPLKDLWHSPKTETLSKFLIDRRAQCNIFPAPGNVFRAFLSTPFDKASVTVLGQDPYHTPGVANGLAFAVNDGKKVPPSLRNIFKEIEFDMGVSMKDSSTSLTGWAEQGVLLLNTALTVEDGRPGSHAKEWQFFTDTVIEILAKRPIKQAFLLWGNHAKAKENLIPRTHNVILTAAHPSPLSVKEFYGCRHFSQVNQRLNIKIDWTKTSSQKEISIDSFLANIAKGNMG